LALAGQGGSPSGTSPNPSDTLRTDPPTNTHRKPMLLLRLSGALLLRYDDCISSGLSLFHDAPRNTRAHRPGLPLPVEDQPRRNLLFDFSGRFAAKG
jgi:hypothetical protein